MAYIDSDTLDNLFGADEKSALCPTTVELTATIELAEADVHSAVVMGGYIDAAPDDYTPSTVPLVLKLAAYGAWLDLAHLRKRKELPETVRVYTHKIELIREGKLEIVARDGTTVSKSDTRAVGGVTSTDVTSTVADGGRAAVFTRTEMEGY